MNPNKIDLKNPSKQTKKIIKKNLKNTQGAYARTLSPSPHTRKMGSG